MALPVAGLPSFAHWVLGLIIFAVPCAGLGGEDGRPVSVQILSDESLFEPEVGKRLLAKLREIMDGDDRRAFHTTGQFKKKPVLSEIISVYGKPDLVSAAKEFYLEGEDAKSFMVTAFYGQLGLTVYGRKRKAQAVNLVTVQHHDFGKELRPKEGKYFYEIPSNRNRVFYVNNKEVGVHVYTGRQEWETVGNIPEGKYVAAGESKPYATIEMDAEGQGTLTFFFPSGPARESVSFKGGKYHGVHRVMSKEGWPLQKAHYDQSRLHGTMTRYYDNGLKLAEASYFQGRIHGAATEYHPNGAVKMKMEYSYGKPMTPLKEYSESGELLRSSDPKAPGSKGAINPSKQPG